MIQKNDKNCGCLIEDILNEEKEEGEKILNNSPKLCPISSEDIEIFIEPDVEKTSLDFYQKKLTDGLPIIPPTKQKVEKFYKYSHYTPEDILTILNPRQGKATIEKIAINGVMSGCLPQFMPILETAIKAIGNQKFNISAINATTHPVSVCILINGPIRNTIEINCKTGCLGPGNIANASIGRAVRLCLINIAGAVPEIGDYATLGSPSKYTYCFGENEEENPWISLHEERGFKKEEDTVTVFGIESPYNVNDHRSENGYDLLDTIINTISTAGSNNSHVPGELLIIMSPEHAQTIYNEDLSKLDVKKYIHENSLVHENLANRGGRLLDTKWLKKNMVPLTRTPEDVNIVVAGGSGRHTMIAQGFGTSTTSVTEKILK